MYLHRKSGEQSENHNNRLKESDNFNTTVYHFNMTYHIVNGDSLAYSFPETGIKGDMIVFRECLMDGDLGGSDRLKFLQSRAAFLGVSQDEYQAKVISEWEKIEKAPEDSEFNCWFEYDLFCQVNMWFVISIIRKLPIRKKVFAVYTSYLDKNSNLFWNGFGPATTEELSICFADRILLNEHDLQLGDDLWTAYKNGDLDELVRLSENQSRSFPHLKEVVEAQVARIPKDGSKGRPVEVLEEIIDTVSTDFRQVFKEFYKRESIYGFGDTQVKKIYDTILSSRSPL